MNKIDTSLLISVTILSLFGLFMIYDVSSFVAFRDFEDKYHYIRDQFLWVTLGFGALTFFTIFDYRRLYALALPIFLIALILLTLVFIPGIGVGLLGAHRWIDMGFFLLQPAEFVKLGLAIYLAAWFSNKEKGRLPAFLLLMGLVLGLVMAEPDMGTTIVILAEALIIYFLSGAKIFYFSLIVPLIGFLGYLLIKISPYRTKRLDTFLNIDLSLESSYHVKQILIALGSGGLMGVGLGNSLQKYAYLPESTTDSIFAIIAEELGFVGAVGLILFFIFIIYRCFRIVVNCRDNFGKLLAGGITTFLAIQAIINLAAQTALVPLTGIPLPFISYGGSALIVDLAAVGILLNISKNKV
ncbi:MAG: putative lipid II flippase FtsW [Candidatus Levybacteria bacterium]|nr:putative lipid II flippase FtsW [Candidatus Levybacteria bacterium]MDZ4227828.1 putative lipid II flippase FtsW [Candidatus Levybacteria bacterium]